MDAVAPVVLQANMDAVGLDVFDPGDTPWGLSTPIIIANIDQTPSHVADPTPVTKQGFQPNAGSKGFLCTTIAVDADSHQPVVYTVPSRFVLSFPLSTHHTIHPFRIYSFTVEKAAKYPEISSERVKLCFHYKRWIDEDKQPKKNHASNTQWGSPGLPYWGASGT